MNKIIYIAGPYRAETEAQVYENIQNARNAAAELARNGIMFFCPHMHSAFMGGIAPDEFWLDLDFEFLKKCDAILMLGGWSDSIGSVEEHEYAQGAGMKVYYSIERAINDYRKA